MALPWQALSEYVIKNASASGQRIKISAFYSQMIAKMPSINKIIRKMKDFMEGASLLKQTHAHKKNNSKTNWPILWQERNTHIYAGSIAVYISTYSLEDMKPSLTERC